MRIISDIEFKLAGNETVLALGIKHSKLPAVAKIGELKMMIEDNPIMMGDLLGLKICQEIKQFK